MANSVAARLHGDDYQALVFWQHACRLLRGEEGIEAIEIESEDLKSLDDVVLYFKDGYLDERGHLVKCEGIQVKYHVDYRGCLNAASLIDPAFINAKSVSFLQRAFNLWISHKTEGFRFVFSSLWAIDPNDELRQLVSGNDCCIEVEKLRDKGPRTKLGKIVKLWGTHLKISNEELLQFLESISIVENVQKTVLLDYVNKDLMLAGLSPVEKGALINPYYELARSLIKGHRTRLTRNDLITLCKQSQLWRGYPMPFLSAKRIGVRSRLQGTQGFCEWADKQLDLVDKFAGRALKPGLNWGNDVFVPLSSFLREQLKSGECCELWMPAHATIAAAIGYILDSKQGVKVHVRQTMVSGTETWQNSLPNTDNKLIGEWITHDETMGKGGDIAIAVSVTHNILDDVLTYAQDADLKISVLRHFLHLRCGKQAISSQEEATALVEKVIESVRQLKRVFINRETARKSVVHVFAAMPNFMTFALGQRLKPLGLVQLYEHDFESGFGADYVPSLQLPVTKEEQ